ncbi:MAG: tRNA (N(6)-L-threonylcarbamoyladenosine(37)-C(2))-methylthiotransferase MtaB [Tissierellia bacterium]|nr:tRNA (N(6)-L-threonylcarbamoyladenosine(37)-C(2))-methylthiotransferase MtaB [Tissierellia bacterium]
MLKVNIKTIGCKVNQYESEAMAELFRQRGFSIVDGEIADICIVNTCTVTHLSSRKSRQFLSKAKRDNPNCIVAAVGCYSQISPEEIKALGGIDILLGTADRDRIVELCLQELEQRGGAQILTEAKHHRDFENLSVSENAERTRAYIKVQEGCNRYCSYCIIPYARGPIRSRQSAAALEEAERLAQNGYREVVLTGIHLASYGLDQKDPEALLDLIERMGEIPGIQRIRLGSLEPGFINPERLHRLSQVPAFCDHFHLSLQSGSDTVLIRMNRKYSSSEYREKVGLIRSVFPHAGITTDIIVGFPGETDDEFEQTCQFVKEIGFSRVHIFKYSPREGTPAADYPNQIQPEIKSLRSDKLQEIADETQQIAHRAMLEQILPVLLEEGDQGRLHGYATNYMRVEVQCPETAPGDIVRVRIVDVTKDSLKGICIA